MKNAETRQDEPVATTSEVDASTEDADSRKRPGKLNPTRWPLGVFVSAAIIFVSVIGMGLFIGAWVFLSSESSEPPAAATGKSAFALDLAHSTVIFLGVVTIGGVAAVAYRRQITLETQTGLKEKQAALEEKQALLGHSKEKRAGRADLHARYQQCAALLGHEKSMIRIAGVYALEALAKEWDALEDGRAQRDVCIDLLCGYLKSKPEFETIEDTAAYSGNGASTKAPVMTAGEADVRLAITTVINRNLHATGDPKKPGLWSDHDYDLTNAFFAPETSFDGAMFYGDFWFAEATFYGDVRFDGVMFYGDAWFSKATFYGDAWFGNATVNGDAWFFKAMFYGDAWFGKATFNGDVWFEATFNRDAGFEETTFNGDAWFGKTMFNRNARFLGAKFGGRANFDEAKFGRYARFNEATFVMAPTFVRVTISPKLGWLNGLQLLSPFWVKSVIDLGVEFWVPDRGRVL